jgi:hypothetical protein
MKLNITHPHRVAHSYTQHLNAAPTEVFPLLCPVRECEWVNGWKPRSVITTSGVAERDCIFTTASGHGEAVWVVTEYEPPVRIEFLKVTAGETVGRINIELRPHGASGTLADISYTYTALSERGATAIDAFTAEYYERFMKAWEDELNHFLRTGRKLETVDATGD